MVARVTLEHLSLFAHPFNEGRKAPCKVTRLRTVDLALFVGHSLLMLSKAAASTITNTLRSAQGFVLPLSRLYMINT